MLKDRIENAILRKVNRGQDGFEQHIQIFGQRRLIKVYWKDDLIGHYLTENNKLASSFHVIEGLKDEPNRGKYLSCVSAVNRFKNVFETFEILQEVDEQNE